MNMKKAMVTFCLVSSLLGASALLATENAKTPASTPSQNKPSQEKTDSLKKVLVKGKNQANKLFQASKNGVKAAWNDTDAVERTCIGAGIVGAGIIGAGIVKAGIVWVKNLEFDF